MKNFLVLLFAIPGLLVFNDSYKIPHSHISEYTAVGFDFEGFVKEIKKNPNFNPDGKYRLIKAHQKDKSRNLIEFQCEEGTCVKKYICIVDGSAAKYIIEVYSECDADLSYAVYERLYDYHLGADLKLAVHKSVKHATNKSLIDKNGYLKNGLTLDDKAAMVKIDTTTIAYDLNELSVLKKYPEINK